MIGGTSLVGPHVIRELLSAVDTSVWTLTRTGSPYFCETSLSGDRDDFSVVKDAIAAAQPNVIIDMIPFTARNADTLAAAVRSIGVKPRLVAVSSIDVYRAFGRLNKTEDAPFQSCPISESMELRIKLGPQGTAYDKISVEQIYADAFEDATILRLPATYGWPDTTRVEQYLDQMLDGAATINIPDNLASFRFSRCLHKNAAFAIALAAHARHTGYRVYNVAEAKVFSELEWAGKIAACCGWRGEITVTPWTSDAERPQQQFEVATDAIRKELGFYEKYDVDEGLSDTVAFHAYQRLGKSYAKYY